MALHTYVKEQKSVPKKIAKSLSYFSLIIGALLLFWAYYPVIYSEIYGRVYIHQFQTLKSLHHLKLGKQ
jgi:hypothetical protein